MIELRPARSDEMGAIGSLGGYVYGGAFGDGPDSMTGSANRAEWTLCAFDGSQLAASFITIPFTMRLNGEAMKMGGVSGVATHPEYRRRGLMRRLMTEATLEMREQGQTVAALWASQAAIYQRFGYSIGSVSRRYAVDSVDISFFDGDGGSSTVEWLSVEAGFDAVRALYIAFIAERTGYLHRSRALWAAGVLEERPDEGPVHIALSRDGDGQPNGYMVYTLRAGKVAHRARSQELVIRDLGWLTLDAYRSLWSYVARHDLVGRAVWATAPADDPAEELFSEPRMLHTEDGEGAWFRVIDVEAALSGRGYSQAGQVTLRLPEDDLAPWNAGTYTIETDGEETTVARSTGEPDAVVPVKAMASLFSGYRSARRLRSWGLLSADDSAVDRLDRLFETRHLPHFPDHF
ncbi:MAG: GNAT family N-acetyltransferase [Acidimicrobiales bacterium]